LVVAALTLPRTAASEPGAELGASVELDAIVVELESGCVTADEFMAEVRSRAPRAREALPEEPVRRVHVTISGDTPVIGRLVMAGNDGAVIAREVEGATCQEVTNALALVLAVTLDPLTNPTLADGTATRAVVRKSPPRSAPPPDRPKRPATRPRARPGREMHWQQFAGGEITFLPSLVDQLMTGLGARYAVSRRAPDGSRLLVTLGAFATFAADAPANHPSGGVIRYRLQALDAGVCPLGGAFLGERMVLYPCAGLSVGRFQAGGVDLPGPRTDSALLLAASVAGRITIELVGPLSLTGASGLFVPLGRYSVLVTGAEQVAGKVHPVGIVATFGIVAKLL
jgi:hypothetical protein